MHAVSLDAERAALRDRLCQLSTEAWAAEVDRLARFESVTVDEALTLLARRFGVEYLDARRHVVWRMLEYLFLQLEPEAWRDPLRRPPTRRKARSAAA